MVIPGGIVVLTRRDVTLALANHEDDIVAAVRSAYQAHELGRTVVPQSVFLTFPDHPGDRIIALPAFLDEGLRYAGVKWISSFPANIMAGKERASGVIVLNDIQDGRPIAVMEASVVSACRTAASAALALSVLHASAPVETIGFIGAGPINCAIARFMRCMYPHARFIVYDTDRSRSAQWSDAVAEPGAPVAAVVDSIESLTSACDALSIATNSATPYLRDLSMLKSGVTILHVSLRDICPEAIVQCDNIVDDVDHVCRANTSLDLAQRMTGDRSFIRATLGEVLIGRVPARPDPDRTTVFSPFGLGILDLAVATLTLAQARGFGTRIADFFDEHTA